MKIKILFLALIGFMMAVPAMADFYVSGAMGMAKNTGDIHKNFAKQKYKTSSVYSVAFGYDLPFVDIVRV